ERGELAARRGDGAIDVRAGDLARRVLASRVDEDDLDPIRVIAAQRLLRERAHGVLDVERLVKAGHENAHATERGWRRAGVERAEARVRRDSSAIACRALGPGRSEPVRLVHPACKFLLSP